MTLKELGEFKKQVEKETHIDADNVHEMTLKILNIRMRYLDKYSEEKQKLKAIDLEMSKQYSRLYEHYKFNGNYKLDTKSEVEAFIKGDAEYHRLRIKYEAQELAVDYLHLVCSTIEKYGYYIKSHIDFMQLKNGNVVK